jgi:hypothetical protein
MRAALFAVFAVTALTGCPSEAELTLELHRASTTSTVSVDVCDAARPQDCDLGNGVVFDGLVCRLGIYLDDTITPPLSIKLLHTAPGTCRMLDVDPAREDGLVVVTFTATGGDDLVISDCTTCGQRACP